MRVLALDHGTVRIGCAISDPSGTLATPLPVIEPPEPRAVAELVAEHEVERVVVGLPLHLSGEEGSQAALARTFCAELEAMLDDPGRDLRRAPDHADGRCEPARRRRRRAPATRSPPRTCCEAYLAGQAAIEERGDELTTGRATTRSPIPTTRPRASASSAGSSARRSAASGGQAGARRQAGGAAGAAAAARAAASPAEPAESSAAAPPAAPSAAAVGALEQRALADDGAGRPTTSLRADEPTVTRAIRREPTGAADGAEPVQGRATAAPAAPDSSGRSPATRSASSRRSRRSSSSGSFAGASSSSTATARAWSQVTILKERASAKSPTC